MKARLAVKKLVKRLYARYYILDNYGSRQFAWTMKDAIDWMKYSSEAVVIVDRYKCGEVIARRFQSNPA